MHSSLIGKIEKARRYAQEPQRISFEKLTASFRGENDTHTVSFADSSWHCTCEFFTGWDVCCHTMAMERILSDMMPKSGSQEQLLAAAR